MQFEFYSVTRLHPACEVSTVLIVVVSTQKRPETKYPEIPIPTKNSAHVINTSVSQENSIVSQESSSSDVEMKCKAHSVLTIYKSVTTF